MNKYLVTIESNEYNPTAHKFESKQFSGEFEAKTERGAKTKAKNLYGYELDTEPSEIKIISVEIIK
jgi:hypothetical protein